MVRASAIRDERNGGAITRRVHPREAAACVSFQNGITGIHAIGWRVGSFLIGLQG